MGRAWPLSLRWQLPNVPLVWREWSTELPHDRRVAYWENKHRGCRRGIIYAASQGPEICFCDDMDYSSSNPEIMLVHVQSYSDDVDQLVTKQWWPEKLEGQVKCCNLLKKLILSFFGSCMYLYKRILIIFIHSYLPPTLPISLIPQSSLPASCLPFIFCFCY